jgi:small subunit ribosomal protein S6
MTGSPLVSQYEAMFLLPGSASSDVEKAVQLCRSIIERHHGQILTIKKWDERKLAYEIDGNKRGVYVVAFFKAPRKDIAAIERDVHLSEDILRVLVLRADHLNQEEMEAVEPQPIVKEERNPWDRPPERDERGPRPPRREEREGSRATEPSVAAKD